MRKNVGRNKDECTDKQRKAEKYRAIQRDVCRVCREKFDLIVQFHPDLNTESIQPLSVT